MPNLVAYALDLAPLGGTPGAAAQLPLLGTETAGPTTYLTFTFRKRNGATDVTYTLQSNPSLLSPWADLVVDGADVIYEVVDPDLDGDGSASLVRYKVKVQPSDGARFLRLLVTQ